LVEPADPQHKAVRRQLWQARRKQTMYLATNLRVYVCDSFLYSLMML
jgi:hypothetical protein